MILLGLLTVTPFIQPAVSDTTIRVVIYLLALLCTVVAVALLVAPVAWRLVLPRRQPAVAGALIGRLVTVGMTCLMVALVVSALILVSVLG